MALGTLFGAFFAFLVLVNGHSRRCRRSLHLLPPALLFLFDVIDGNEGNGCAVWRLNIDLSRQGTLVMNFQVLSVLFSKDDVTEVDGRVLDFYERLLASADQWDINLTSLAEDGED